MVDLRQVFDDLVRFETILWNALDERLQRQFGVSMASLNAMLIIASTPSCRVQDIADAVAITVGGASQAVDRLETAGLCARRPNPADRRSSILELTPAGQELVKRAGAVFDEELATFLQTPLSERSLGQLATALATVRAAANQRNTSRERHRTRDRTHT